MMQISHTYATHVAHLCVSGELYDCEHQQLHAEWADLSMDRSQDVLNSSCTLVRSGLPPPLAEQLPAASSSNVLDTDSFSLAQQLFFRETISAHFVQLIPQFNDLEALTPHTVNSWRSFTRFFFRISQSFC